MRPWQMAREGEGEASEALGSEEDGVGKFFRVTRGASGWVYCTRFDDPIV